MPLRILLVDDMEDTHRLIQAFVRPGGHELHSASNGLEALEKLRAERFSIILMDIEMPIMNGIEATAELKKRGDQTPIIALTGRDDPKEIAALLRSGFSAHLSKPVRRQILLELLAKLSDKPSHEPSIAPFASVPFEFDPELEHLIPGYIQNRRSDLKALESLLAEQKMDEVGRLAHQIKGTAQSYGFPILGRLASQIEESCGTEAFQTIRHLVTKMKENLDLGEAEFNQKHGLPQASLNKRKNPGET